MKLVEAQEAAASSTGSSAARSRRSCGACSAAARPRRPGGCRASRPGWSSSASARGWRSGPAAWTTSKARSSPRPTRSSRSAPRSSSSTASRVADGRDFDPATGAARRRPRRRAARRRRAPTRSPTGSRDVPFRVACVESNPFTERPTRAVHDVDAPAGGGPQAALHARPRTMAVAQRLYERGYITYMRTDSTNLSEQAITAARTAIREQYGDEYLPGRAAHVPQQGEERAGGARGDPARRRRDPHARRRARRARQRRAAPLRADLDAHGRVPDGRRARPQGDHPPRRRRRPRASTRCSAPSGKTYDFLGCRRAYVEDVDEDDEVEARGAAARRSPRATRSRAPSSRRSATRRSRRRATPRRAS